MKPTNQQINQAVQLREIDPRIDYLDSGEAQEWLMNSSFTWCPAKTLGFALLNTNVAENVKLNKLIVAMLDGITFEQMGDLRDLLRSALIDETKFQIRETMREVA